MSSQPTQTPLSLSFPAKLACYFGPPSLILLTSLVSNRTALLSPLTFLPPTYLYNRWRVARQAQPDDHADLEPLVWTFASMGTLGPGAVALVQGVSLHATSILLFGLNDTRRAFLKEFGRGTIQGLTSFELAQRARLASSWQNWLLIGLLSFGMAGLLEEALKLVPIIYARKRRTEPEHYRQENKLKTPSRQQRNRAYLDFALAGALSFGVIENIAFLYGACETGFESGPRLALTVFERVVVGSTGHFLMSAITALRATRLDLHGKPVSWWKVLAPAVLLHGAFDFVAMGSSALEGNVGWIHPTHVTNTAVMITLCSSLVGIAAWWTRREWRTLVEAEHRR